MKKIVIILSLILAVTGCTSTGTSEKLVDNGVAVNKRLERPMRILMINDDGYDALGAQMLYEELESKGHEVWIVAPIDNQSGAGTSIKWNKKPHKLVKYGERKYAFEGSPTDCFKVAVNLLMDEKPDLVISGVNDGPNFGEVQFNSGTVGGAARAIRHGYPSMAVSLVYYGGDDENLGSHLEPAVDYTANIVEKLSDEWKAGRMIMPLGTGISINYPLGSVKGLKFIGNENVYTDFQNYKYGEDGKIYNYNDMEKFSAEIKDISIETDLTESNRGYITVTVIDGDWDASGVKAEYMEEVLKGIQF
ncbi:MULTISPECIES: 5'/3'-nucleotidase SurE [Psychrilyobacter]|nr:MULTISPECIES: 5'/3'-nucleotidase SurE [Psychrilyobacter]